MSTIKKEAADFVKIIKDTKVRIVLFLLLVILGVSLFLWLNGSSKNRYVLRFEHMNEDGLYVESRFLPKVPKEDSLRLFIDDMLLGPVGDRYKALFPQGTRVTSFFVDGKSLYVTLSEEALYILGNESSQNKEGAEIFRKNVFRNFRNIDIINLYIDGRKMYEE